MKISLIIVSTLLILSVFVPILLFILNGTKNTSNIKKQINTLIKDNGITYDIKEIWRKNFIAIDNNHKIISSIQFNENEPFISIINLADVKQCHVIKDSNIIKGKPVSLKKLDLEFIFKSSTKPNAIINFFNIDNDLTEDFELQRIEKWQALINKAITEPQIARMAS
ncbi:hypothetical protein [Pseudalgibacter alginicilyticus]|nr:hypothetical protein [Pseudalgibacter alginicilyticus]